MSRLNLVPNESNVNGMVGVNQIGKHPSNEPICLTDRNERQTLWTVMQSDHSRYLDRETNDRRSVRSLFPEGVLNKGKDSIRDARRCSDRIS